MSRNLYHRAQLQVEHRHRNLPAQSLWSLKRVLRRRWGAQGELRKGERGLWGLESKLRVLHFAKADGRDWMWNNMYIYASPFMYCIQRTPVGASIETCHYSHRFEANTRSKVICLTFFKTEKPWPRKSIARLGYTTETISTHVISKAQQSQIIERDKLVFW